MIMPDKTAPVTGVALHCALTSVDTSRFIVARPARPWLMKPQRTRLSLTLTTETARSASTRQNGHKDETFPDGLVQRGTTCQDADLPWVDDPVAIAADIASFLG
jgi:hypothetical protein